MDRLDIGDGQLIRIQLIPPSKKNTTHAVRKYRQTDTSSSLRHSLLGSVRVCATTCIYNSTTPDKQTLASALLETR